MKPILKIAGEKLENTCKANYAAADVDCNPDNVREGWCNQL